MVLTGLSLAFTTIPEEPPLLITAVLGLGSYRLARGQAIVKRLQAAETLVAVTVIATDKTGTLTENRHCWRSPARFRKLSSPTAACRVRLPGG